MKLEIYDDTKPEMEPTVFLKLKESASGIQVLAVNADGTMHSAGHLLVFKPDGRIFMYGGIDETFGFDLTGSQRIKIE